MATKLQLSWFIFLCSRITDLCHHTWIQKASLTMSLVGFTYVRASFWGVWGHIINMEMFNLCRRIESIDTLVRKGSHFRCNYVGRKRHTTNKQMPLPPKKRWDRARNHKAHWMNYLGVDMILKERQLSCMWKFMSMISRRWVRRDKRLINRKLWNVW